MEFALSPGALVLLALAEVLYLRAVRVLRRRGYRVPALQQVSWHTGMLLQAVALLGPLDAEAQDHLSAHMAQHLLLADLAVPFLLIGIRTPVMVFMLPRSLLVPLAHQWWLRRAFRFLRQPLVAIPAYLAILYFWHLGFAFEGALRHPLVHALQHASFVLAGVLVWWAALEPQRRRVPGELWKIPYIFAGRMVSMFLGMALVFARSPFYAGIYGHDSLSDQRAAGGIMMSVDVAIMLAALIFFFWRSAADADRAERRAAAAAT
jgi:putative membrane protein